MEKPRWTLTQGRSREDLDGRDAGIYPPAIFQALLRHERSRSDREGSRFSLVVLEVTGSRTNGCGVGKIARIILQKMRSIDEAGWLDEGRIGIMLPATKAEGGRGFARRLCESIATPQPVPYEVYTYPDHWMPDTIQGEDGGDNRNGSHRIVAAVFSRRIPAWKRCSDIVGSLLLIVFFSPLFLALAVYIKAVSPGRVFFKQKRVGYRGKLFTFLKFRTMHENNNPEVHRQYLKELIKSAKPMEKLDFDGDRRIIPGGKILRKACLDEFPQLLNVLKGEMSLVGPRPCIPYEAEEYLRWHTHRFDILPGMTGLWQVSGKNRLSFEQMIRLDISYANHMSPLLDLKILLLTPPTIAGMVFEAAMDRLRNRFAKPRNSDAARDQKEESLGDA